MTSRAELLARLKRAPRTEILRFAMTADHADELAELRGRASTTRLFAQSGDEDAQRKLAEIEARIAELETEGGVIEWHLTGIGAHARDELMNAYPPTPEQLAKARADAEAAGQHPDAQIPAFDVEKFPFAVVAACTTRIVIDGDELTDITADDVREIVHGAGWPGQDVNRLIKTAFDLDVKPAALVDAVGKD